MTQKMQLKTENAALDVLKGIACALIASSHLPSFWNCEMIDAYYLGWFLRICVPLFFVCSGYFFFQSQHKERFLLRIALLYVLGYLLYLPLILQGAENMAEGISRLRWNLVIGYEHLWYLNATLFGFLIWYGLERILQLGRWLYPAGIPICVLLILMGGLLDEYYPLCAVPWVKNLGEFISRFGGPRNVVFMGLPLLLLGGGLARYDLAIRKIPTFALVLCYLVLRALALWEIHFLFGARGLAISCDITFFNCFPAVILMALALRIPVKIPWSVGKQLRTMTEYVYILHPLVGAYLVRTLALPPFWNWICTVVFCCCLTLLLEKQFLRKRTE